MQCPCVCTEIGCTAHIYFGSTLPGRGMQITPHNKVLHQFIIHVQIRKNRKEDLEQSIDRCPVNTINFSAHAKYLRHLIYTKRESWYMQVKT